LVVVGVIEITVPFVVAITLKLVSLLVTIVDQVATISITDDVLKISLTLAVLIR
jgi:hypothetical protein